MSLPNANALLTYTCVADFAQTIVTFLFEGILAKSVEGLSKFHCFADGYLRI